MSISRIFALVDKEWRQTVREPSCIAIGVILPIILLLTFGYGLSLDMKRVRLGIVSPVNCKPADEIVERFRNNPHFEVTLLPTLGMARDLLASRKADAVLSLPQQLVRADLQRGTGVDILVNSTSIVIADTYRHAILRTLLSGQKGPPPFVIRSRMWFNEAVKSTWFLVPGVLVIVMSIIGCLLTALQMAKEYEQGTIEQLFATPATAGDLLVAKLLCNYVIGMVAFVISALFSRFVFGVPMVGSLVWIWVGASFYLFTQMAVGLVISSVAKSQFISALLAVILSFLPVVVLSGFFYDISSMSAAMQWVTAFIPARYFAEFVLTSFLVGDIPTIYVRDLLALAGFIAVLLATACVVNAKNAGRGGR